MRARLAARGFPFLMSPSAHQSIRSGSDSILVDAVEAFVAAIYLDGGYQAAKTFIYDQPSESGVHVAHDTGQEL